jgi:hypothetical protein
MVTRVRPGEAGHWQVAIGSGPAGFGRDGFTDRAAAEDWAAQASLALRASMVRIGSKRFLGTAAEALRRWAIDQGTLPLAEGGTQIAPLQRLAALIADADCALPLAALTPADLARLRRRRLAALGCSAGLLGEQAALAAALDHFREFFLPALDDPFAEVAEDGLCILDEATCAQAIGWAGQVSDDLSRAVGLLLTTAAPVEALLACSQGHADREGGRLCLPGGLTVPAPHDLLPHEDADPEAPLLGRLRDAAALRAGVAEIGRRLDRPGLLPEALRLTGLTIALQQGQHLDEVLSLAGARGAALV